MLINYLEDQGKIKASIILLTTLSSVSNMNVNVFYFMKN